MRLCYVGSLASVHLRRWTRFFGDAGHEVHVISPVAAPPGEEVTGQIHVLPSMRPAGRSLTLLSNSLACPARVLWFQRVFRTIRPDLVHAHYLNEAAMFALLAGARPFVGTAWGSDVLIAPKDSRLVRAGLRIIARRSDLLTCDASHVKEVLVHLGASPDRVQVIYFGTDVEWFHPGRREPALRARFAPDGVVVISLRRLAPVYDVGTLIAAVPLILHDLPGASFLIAGGGPDEPALRALAEELGVAARVHFVGELSEKDLPRYLASSDIYVSTALSDGGIAASTAEAMACALPVVITDVAANREWVDDGASGFLVPPRNPSALADRILRIAADPAMRHRVGAQARRVIEERNNWRTQMARVEALYEGLVRRHTVRDFSLVTEQPLRRVGRGTRDIIWRRYALAARYSAGARVLEVGCGPGFGLGILASRATGVVGGDLTAANLARAAATYRRRRGVHLVQMDGDVLPFCDGAFDTVLALAVIYYLNLAVFLQECRRVLRMRGVLVFCSSNPDAPGFRPSRFSTAYYSLDQLHRIVQEHGFDVEFFGAFPPPQSGARVTQRLVALAGTAVNLLPVGTRVREAIKDVMGAAAGYQRVALFPEIQEEDLRPGEAEPLVPLVPDRPTTTFRVLYGVAYRRA